ncbi:hypothetical protein H2199_006465 [Coniosporium tulheliwenetii]|uniref:Uncharacterized protein n=1 Tax=Coniosporium tulheliwenetii TaxID=3383036 RepID=A0ACC2YVJ9_9PEZI|nr:hypothetical protein H2199_006465 [Cladosporium sp. JES 115]
MLRHGLLRSPISWTEVKQPNFQGIWITPDPSKKPDIVVFYCHGGGFSMGTTYFYLEFLLAWVSLLRAAGYTNPSLFALEYTLVPDAVYPTQVQQTFAGYAYVLSLVRDPSHVVVGGDSAGATLILSMLLYVADHPEYRGRLPGMAVMISPWVEIVSEKRRDTASDYLCAESLDLYGRQYIGSKWLRASPSRGWFFLFGSEEVLAPETRDLISLLRKAGAEVDVHEEEGSVHAWPVAALYLGESRTERLKGLRDIVKVIRRRLH